MTLSKLLEILKVIRDRLSMLVCQHCDGAIMSDIIPHAKIQHDIIPHCSTKLQNPALDKIPHLLKLYMK